MTTPASVLLCAEITGKNMISHWIEKAAEQYDDDVMRALMNGGLTAFTMRAVAMFGARDAYNLLQRAADACAEVTI